MVDRRPTLAYRKPKTAFGAPRSNMDADRKTSGPLKLLIRADASPEIGTGHVMRTFALGQAWRRLGGSVTFVCGQLPKSLVLKIENEGFGIFQVTNANGDIDDANETAKIIADLQPDWIAVDGYRFDDDYQSAIKVTDSLLMVVDDYRHAEHANADLVLNQNAYAKLDDYRTLSQSRILTGPSFAILRNEFLNGLPSHQTRGKHIPKTARRILVTYGGSDEDNWTLKTLKLLSDLNRKRLIVDCVIGACYAHLRELETFKKTANMSLRIHRNVNHMSTLMEHVDLAISAGGSTCYELARCGVPGIVVSIADNQVPVAQAMDDYGTMVSVDRESNHLMSDPVEERTKRLKKIIRRILNDFELRQTMSNRGMTLVDGQGGSRIAKEMAAHLFSFRLATAEDAEMLLNWRNDPEVRSVSFNDAAIELDSHIKWLGRRLNDPNTAIWVAENRDRRPVGQVRFELNDSGTQAIVSIIVEQSMRGRGVGKVLIALASEEFFESSSASEIVAQIKPGNVASEKAFKAAGFQLTEPTIVNEKIAIQMKLVRDRQPEHTSVRRSA